MKRRTLLALPLAAALPAARAQADRPLRIMVAGDSVGWSLAWAASRSDLLTSVQISNRALIGCGILPARAVRLYAAGDPAPYDAACADSTDAQFLGPAEHPALAFPDVVGALAHALFEILPCTGHADSSRRRVSGTHLVTPIAGASPLAAGRVKGGLWRGTRRRW